MVEDEKLELATVLKRPVEVPELAIHHGNDGALKHRL
jgi:hypothetical protein